MRKKRPLSVQLVNGEFMKRALLFMVTVALAAPASAEVLDAPPVNAAEMLNSLKQFRELNQKGMVTRRNDVIQRVTAAAASGEKAAAFWKDAVKAVEFEGAKREAAQLRGWREGYGEAFSDKLCQNAARLHLYWLGLTLRRAAGVEIPDLLPNVIEFVKQVQADEAASEHLSEQIQKAMERDNASPAARKKIQEDTTVRRVRDDIMRLPVTGGPVARWLGIEEILMGASGGKGSKADAPAAAWEYSPGSVDGIYETIILPEFRARKDPRLLEYWDMMLKREARRMADVTLDVEKCEWAAGKRPSLLWRRAQDVLLIGQRNRAIGEMFNIIKTHPGHLEAVMWMDALQEILAPPAPPAPDPASPAPAPPAPAK